MVPGKRSRRISTFHLSPISVRVVSTGQAERYADFLRTRGGQHILLLELGVGYNTPVIIKFPFWQMTKQNPKAVYACINTGDAVCPRDIEKQAICIDADIAEVLRKL